MKPATDDAYQAKLQLHSGPIVALFLRGWSIVIIGRRLGHTRKFIEDAIRWELKRRDKKRRRP